MEEILVVDAKVRCDHDGRIENRPSQQWTTIEQVPVLVDDDPEGREINACPNRGANIRRCTKTLRVEKGYSIFVRIDGKAIVLASLEGKTDGTPPGFVHYRVRNPGQTFVWVEA
jgi:hypothetical protein